MDHQWATTSISTNMNYPSMGDIEVEYCKVCHVCDLQPPEEIPDTCPGYSLFPNDY